MTATATPLPRGSITLDRDREAPAGATGAILQIPLELIDVGENVRKTIDGVDELAASIAELGVLSPISVRDLPGDRYAINTGQTRYLACKQLGLATIPAIVDNTQRTPAELAIAQLAENLAKNDMRPMETAVGLRTIVEAGYTQADTAKMVGYAATTVTNYLGLLDAPAEIQAAIAGGTLSPAHAKAVKGLPADQQVEYASRAVRGGWSAHFLEEEVQRQRRQVAADKERAAEASNLEAKRITELQDKLRELATKVVPGDTKVVVSRYVYGNDHSKLQTFAVSAAGGLGFAAEAGTSSNRLKGWCDCTAYAVDIDYYGNLTLRTACVVQAHAAAKGKADSDEFMAKQELHQRVRQKLGTQLEAEISQLSPLALRILAWKLQGYRLESWAEKADPSRTGRKRDPWASLREANVDEVRELALKGIADLNDGHFNVDWPNLADELGLNDPKPERPATTPETPAFGQVVHHVNGSTYRISKIAGSTLHLAANTRQWRNEPVIARAKAEQLTWDAEAKAWHGPVNLTKG